MQTSEPRRTFTPQLVAERGTILAMTAAEKLIAAIGVLPLAMNAPLIAALSEAVVAGTHMMDQYEDVEPR